MYAHINPFTSSYYIRTRIQYHEFKFIDIKIHLYNRIGYIKHA
jgi:hypothetical protein